MAVVAILAVGCASAPPARGVRHVEFRPDRFVLRASPRLGLSGIRPLLTAEILEARDFTCPSITWYLPDDTAAFEEADCEADASPDEVRWVRRLPPLPPGSWTFRALVKQGKLERRAEVTILVAGGE